MPYPIEPVLKPDQHEFHTGHLQPQKFVTFSGPHQLAHRPGTPLLSTTTTDVALPVQRAQVWAPAVTRYSMQYSKIEKYYGIEGAY